MAAEPFFAYATPNEAWASIIKLSGMRPIQRCGFVVKFSEQP